MIREAKTVEYWRQRHRADRKGGRGRFRILTREILNSEAFMELSRSRVGLLALLMVLDKLDYEPAKKSRDGQRTQPTIKKDGIVTLVQNEFKARGVSGEASIAKAKRELVRVGFLDVVRTGTVHSPGLFQWSWRWKDYPLPASLPNNKPTGLNLYHSIQPPF